MFAVISFDLSTLSWSTLPHSPLYADAAYFVESGRDIYLVNPNGNNIMQFHTENLTFTLVPGKSAGVVPSLATAATMIAVDDTVFQGC